MLAAIGRATSTCLASFRWDTTGLSGEHTLQVKLSTERGQTAVSAPVRVYVHSATRTSLSAMRTVASGSSVRVTGRVISAANGAGTGGPALRFYAI